MQTKEDVAVFDFDGHPLDMVIQWGTLLARTLIG